MNLRTISTTAIALAALVLLAAACGGGDDETAIRTSKGLAVAAAGAAAGAGGDELALTRGGAEQVSGSGVSGLVQTGGGEGGDVAYAPTLLQQQGPSGITVQGFGAATADADSAVVEFYFGTNVYTPIPEPLPYVPGGAESSSGAAPGTYPTQPAAEPITEAKLQLVIDAITGQGVARDDIELINVYADPYSSSATLRADVKNLDSLDGVVKAARDAASSLTNIGLQNTSVSYTISDCVALEKEAMKAAVEDGKSRAIAFAEALGVGMGGLVGASSYSYSPYGGSACDTGFGGPYPMGGVGYVEGQPQEVQLYANISLTYAIQ